MGFLDKIFELFLDKQIKLSLKAAIVFLIILIALFINNFFNFSSNYVLNNKINQIKDLNIIISDTISDSETKNFAIKQRNEILKHKNFFELSCDFFNEINWESINDHQNHPDSRGGAIHFGITDKRNSIWQHLSSGGLFYILSLFSVFMLFIENSTPIIQRISNSILTFIIFFSIGWLCTLFMTLIPIFNNNYVFLNYILNFILQILLLVAFNKFKEKVI